MPSTAKSKSKSGRAVSQNKIVLSTPHSGGQREIYLHPARFQVVDCGRRYGKTELAKILAARKMIRDNGHVAWVSPTAKMAGAVWREFMLNFAPFADWVSVQEKTIILPNGGKLTLWTAENPDAIRGQAFDLAILDEAAMYKSSDIWYAVIRPALSDRVGGAYFLSTPRGRNWFWELWDFADKDDSGLYKAWHFPSSANPYLPPGEIEEARRTSHERFFRQEYLAEFLLDGGSVFQGVLDISYLSYVQEGHEYPGNFVFGIDFGREYDPTVVSVIDTDSSEQVDLLELNAMAFSSQREEIWKLYRRWKPNLVLAESNTFGAAIIEQLQEEGMYVEPFVTTNQSKQNMIDLLALDIEQKRIKLLHDVEQIRQLQAYQSERTQTGKMKFNAPHGFHDDYVMALALSNWAAKGYSGTFSAKIPLFAA